MAKLFLIMGKTQPLFRVTLGMIAIALAVLIFPSIVIGKAQNQYAPPIITPTLRNVIDTSIWSPPSPDPTGIAYWRAKDSLFITDSEIEGIPGLFTGYNVFESTRSGTLLDTGSTIDYSPEPSGLALDPSKGLFYIADDDLKRIFEVNPGSDGKLGTDDDFGSYFDTTAFGSHDPEGVAYGGGELFIAGGEEAIVFRVNPGGNGKFDGVPPAGDDVVAQFDTLALGIPDPQGVEFNPSTSTLFIAGGQSEYILEADRQGVAQRLIDISSLNIVAASGLSLGRMSDGLHTSLSLYIADRGVDEQEDPSENDGKIFEIVIEGMTLFGQYYPIIR